MSYESLSNEVYKVEVVKRSGGKVLVVTLDRPKALNAIPLRVSLSMTSLWRRYEADAEIRAAILTGKGPLFCAGADLKDWLHQVMTHGREVALQPVGAGFMGISNHSYKKPIIVALNGPALGGATEVVVNADLVVAARNVKLALPEVRRGVAAVAGALPRLARHIGIKRASQLALTGVPISSETAYEWGLINKLVDEPSQVLPAALELADQICLGSPESIMASLISIRRGLEQTQLDVSEATELSVQRETRDAFLSANMDEGLLSFSEKRAAVWKLSKL